MKKLLSVLAFVAASLFAVPAMAANCPSNPFTLINGATADATQVMADLNNILTCSNTNLAHNGANSDITSLSGLTTPITLAQGGTGTTTGNVATATKLFTARSIGMTGDVVWSISSFDGSANVTASSAIQAGAVTTSDLAAGAVTFAKMANLAANSIICNNTGSGATPIACTATQATAMLNNVVGDSGSGGTAGLVPAPPSGSAAAGKVLGAGGSFVSPYQTWANFAGASGTINKSANITSVSRTGTGTYSVAFTTNLADANFAVMFGASGVNGTNNNVVCTVVNGTKATSGFHIQCQGGNANQGTGAIDPTESYFLVVD